MTDRAEPQRARLARAAVGFGAVVGLIAAWVVVRDGRPGGVDLAAQRYAVRHRSEVATVALKLVSHLGAAVVIVAVLLVVGGVVFVRRHDSRRAFALAGSYVGALVLYDVIKILVARPRPSLAERLSSVTGWSFPSGHATQSVAFWGMLAVAVSAGRSAAVRRALWVGAIAIALAVGLSRVYLGVHWISDVVAGWTLGAAWLCLLAPIAMRGRSADG